MSSFYLRVLQRTDAAGKLVFDAGNIVNHFFSVAFLQRIRGSIGTLRYHVAKKKIACVDEDGVAVKVDGVKLELFIFDVFQLADRMGLLHVSRQDEFSPLKNGAGAADSTAAHARADLLALHRRYLVAAGALLDGACGDCELAPALTYAGEGLDSLRGRAFSTLPPRAETLADLLAHAK